MELLMKRPLTLTLFALLTISCTQRHVAYSKGATMTHSVATQAELDAANKRISEFKQELLRQGFHEVSVSYSNSKEQFVFEGEYGTLRDLRVTLSMATRLEKNETNFAGGVSASVQDDQADREFKDLYNKVVLVVTGDEGPRAR
jgi:hypothetical protein